MIKLNKNIRLGQHITIPKHLSWQTGEAAIHGDYVVYQISNDFYDGCVILVRESDRFVLETTPAVVAYLTGSVVKNPPNWTAIDPDEFQPELSDYHRSDYFTEDGEEFGFFYCGWRGDHRTLSSTMVSCTWCYGKLPW